MKTIEKKQKMAEIGRFFIPKKMKQQKVIGEKKQIFLEKKGQFCNLEN